MTKLPNFQICIFDICRTYAFGRFPSVISTEVALNAMKPRLTRFGDFSFVVY